MLIALPKKYRKGRRKARRVGPIFLTSAVYDPSGIDFTLTLTFNCPVDISEIDPTQIIVMDGWMNNEKYTGRPGAVAIASNVVFMELDFLDTYTGSEVLLDASATTGIRAIAGLPWTGVSNFVVQHP